MAEVYEVEDSAMGSRYALKLFTYDRGDVESARMRFFAEGRLLAQLAHPRLVRVYDFGYSSADCRATSASSAARRAFSLCRT